MIGEHKFLSIEELKDEFKVGREWLTEKLRAYPGTIHVGKEMRIARSRIPFFIQFLEEEKSEVEKAVDRIMGNGKPELRIVNKKKKAM